MADLAGFRDRRDAGGRLAERLAPYRGACEAVVLALSRGGVAVGFEVASRIGAALDVLVVRELGVPGHSGLTMGAIASGGLRVVDQRVAELFGVSNDAIAAIEARERTALERGDRAYHARRAPVALGGRTAILVDDGIETVGAMSAAIDAVRTCGPARTIAAVPVASREICEALGDHADDMICLRTPELLSALDAWYDDFAPLTDRQVCQLLDAAGHGDAAP